MTPHVSLVVPSHGGATRLPVLMACLEAQTHDDWEAVVVLDGDVDGSAAVLARWQGILPIRVVTFPVNRGRSAALNAGFALAAGEILVRCDDDLAPSPDYVAQHAAHHVAKRCGVVGLYRNVFPETAYARVYGRRWDERFRDDAYAAAPADAWRYWAGNVSVDRRAWQNVGSYDEEYRAYGWEDVDWGYRLMLAGIPILVVPELETDHHIAATTTAGRCLRAYYSGSARRRFEAKHGIRVLPDGRCDPWRLAVAGTSRLLTERGIGRVGGLVDRLADRLPRWMAEKAVALTVEAGALAGYRRSDAGQAI